MTIETNQDGGRLIFGQPATFEIRYQTETVEWRIEPRAFQLTGGDPDQPSPLGRWEVQLHAEATSTPAAGRGGKPEVTSYGYDKRLLDQEPTEQMLTWLAWEALDVFAVACPDCAGTGEIWEPMDDDEFDGYTEDCPRCNGEGRTTVGRLRRARQQEQAVSAATIAETFSVGARTVHRWVEKYPDFPEPVLENQLGRFYDLEQVKAWHEKKQPRAGRPPKDGQ